MLNEESKDITLAVALGVTIALVLTAIGAWISFRTVYGWVVHKNDKEVIAEHIDAREVNVRSYCWVGDDGKNFCKDRMGLEDKLKDIEVKLSQQKIKVKLKTPIEGDLAVPIGCWPQPCDSTPQHKMISTKEITLQEFVDLLPFVYEPAKETSTSTPARLIQVK